MGEDFLDTLLRVLMPGRDRGAVRESDPAREFVERLTSPPVVPEGTQSGPGALEVFSPEPAGAFIGATVRNPQKSRKAFESIRRMLGDAAQFAEETGQTSRGTLTNLATRGGYEEFDQAVQTASPDELRELSEGVMDILLRGQKPSEVPEAFQASRVLQGRAEAEILDQALMGNPRAREIVNDEFLLTQDSPGETIGSTFLPFGDAASQQLNEMAGGISGARETLEAWLRYNMGGGSY